MKKILVGFAAVVSLVLIVVAAIPVVSAIAWKSDTANDMTEMFAETTKNLEGSIEFLSITEPSKAQYKDEIKRIISSVDKIGGTLNKINDLGPNTVDFTGQYSFAKELQEKIRTNLKNIQEKYESQLDVLAKEQKDGVTVASATEYSDISEELSADYAQLEKLVSQL